MKEEKEAHPFEKLSNPAQRALANAGINTLEELAQLSEAQLMKLHGMGKGSLPKLRDALAEKGLSFKAK